MQNHKDLEKFEQAIEKEALSPNKNGFPSPIDRWSRNQLYYKSLPPFPLSSKFLEKALELELDDKARVELAYKLILQRPADRAGLEFYQKMLQEKGPLFLLGTLRYSKEGRAKNTPITGLAFPFYCERMIDKLKRLSNFKRISMIFKN